MEIFHLLTFGSFNLPYFTKDLEALIAMFWILVSFLAIKTLVLIFIDLSESSNGGLGFFTLFFIIISRLLHALLYFLPAMLVATFSHSANTTCGFFLGELIFLGIFGIVYIVSLNEYNRKPYLIYNNRRYFRFIRDTFIEPCEKQVRLKSDINRINKSINEYRKKSL